MTLITPAFDLVRFQDRSVAFEDARRFLDETAALDAALGRQRESRQKRFEDLRKALTASKLKVVVIGEFSRGKSYLINAMLGMDLLPTAQQQTTAINTFFEGAVDRKPAVEVVRQDGAVIELPYTTDAIKDYGTELVEQYRDARTEVARICVYSDHPLFLRDLILIDTPGFEGILPHHSEVALQAIDESHVAIWVLSAEQLGGNSTEWDFLRSTVSRNFNKFITVVNKWDFVIDPQDSTDKKKREELGQAGFEQSKLDIVRENFQQQADFLEPEKLARIVDDRHLLGVSAWWALSDDPTKRRASRIEDLAGRIEDLCLSGEALQQMLLKPLTALASMQAEIEEEVARNRVALESPADLETLRGQRKDLDFELRLLEGERNNANSAATNEHREAARRFAERIEAQLVAPIRELRVRMEAGITEEYVRRQVEETMACANGEPPRIGLPEDVREDFTASMEQVVAQWGAFRPQIDAALRDLREGYQKELARMGSQVATLFDQAELEPPSMTIEAPVSLRALEGFQVKKLELEASLEAAEREREVVQMDLARLDDPTSKAKLQQALQRVARIEDRLTQLGPQPSPGQYVEYESKKVRDAGVYRSSEYKDVPVTKTDWGPVKEHQRMRRELEQKLENQEAEVERVQKELEDLHGEKVTREAALRQIEREIARRRREEQAIEERARALMLGVVRDTLKSLRAATIGQIDQTLSVLERQLTEAIHQAFETQLETLKAAVEERFFEPIKEHRDRLDETERLVLEGTTALEARRQALAELAVRLAGLRKNTLFLADSIERRFTAVTA